MSSFIIKPQKTQCPRMWDDTFLWEEENIYVMVNHRLALWCWLQCEGILKKEHALIHIDEHFDAKTLSGDEEKCLKEAISDIYKLREIDAYNDLQVSYRGSDFQREEKPCINWDNFIYIAAKAKLFDHYYLYSVGGDWKTDLAEDSYSCYKKKEDVYNIGENIKRYSGKCIVDIDLDFFDLEYSIAEIPKEMPEEDLFIGVFNTILKFKDDIAMITISINEPPGEGLWEKRQNQLIVIKNILEMEMSVPIMIQKI